MKLGPFSGFDNNELVSYVPKAGGVELDPRNGLQLLHIKLHEFPRENIFVTTAIDILEFYGGYKDEYISFPNVFYFLKIN